MGKKKSKTEQSNKPIYSAQIEGAANAQNAAYARQQPVINDYSDTLNSTSSDLFGQFSQGDPTINASQQWVQDTLALSPGDNPYLDDMIAQTNDNLALQIQTDMGTRGNLGSSTEMDILANALAEQELALRYQDYDNLMGRQVQAAGMSPGLLEGQMLNLDAAMKTGNQGAMLPLQASSLNSSSVGGLLGQYQNIEGEQTQSGGLLGSIIGMGIGGLAGNPGIF